MALLDFPPGSMDCPLNHGEKIGLGPVGGVGGGEQHTAKLEDGQRGGHEAAVIFFGTEGPVFLGLGKRGRIEHHGVERAALFGEPPQPVEGIAVNEIVRRRVEPVQGEVAPAPFEIFFGEVKAGGVRARPGRAHGKAAGVGEYIKHGPGRNGGAVRPQGKIRREMTGEEAPPVVALIQKQAGGITLVEAQLKTHAVFPDHKAFLRGFAQHGLRRSLRGFRREWERGAAV